jgi:hypothetical protein
LILADKSTNPGSSSSTASKGPSATVCIAPTAPDINLRSAEVKVKEIESRKTGT